MVFKNIDKDYRDSLLRASLLGIHLVATTFVGLAVGYFLDQWLETQPWLTMLFLALGIAAGFKNMFEEVKKIQKRDEQTSKKK
ncbi:MAG: AtpZ/AtpI family protein [Thermodesulfobacteriota bacterium]